MIGATPVEPAVSDSIEAAEATAEATADELGSTTIVGTPPVDPAGADADELDGAAVVGTVSIDAVADDPGRTTDGSPPSEATLDAALEIALATDETGIGNGRTLMVDSEGAPLEALDSELAWFRLDVLAEAGALPAGCEAAVPLDAAVVEGGILAEPEMLEADAEGTAGDIETCDESIDDSMAVAVCVAELEPALEALEAEGTLGATIVDDAEPEPALKTLDATGTVGTEFVDDGTVETGFEAELLETDTDDAGSADAGAGFDGTGGGLLAAASLDPAVELPVTGVGSTVTVLVPTIVVVPGVMDPPVVDA